MSLTYFFHILGTLILQLLAYDIDGDDVDFILLSSVNNFPNVASEMKLDKNGRSDNFLYKC